MKLLLEPGASLLLLGVILYFVRFLLVKLPVIGGLLGFLAWPAMLFCIAGGIYLLSVSYRNRDNA